MIPHVDDLEALADDVVVDFPTAAQVRQRAAQVQAASKAGRGSLNPVDSGNAMHPMMRLLAKK